MDSTKLKWFVKLDDKYMKVEGFPWGVWKGGFRDSIHECKYLAEQRRDFLNNMEDDNSE